MSTAPSPKPGPYLRLSGISTTQLPPGARAAPSTTHRPSAPAALSALPPSPPLVLLTTLLNEAIPLLSSISPTPSPPSPWKPRGRPRHFSSSAAPVSVLSRVINHDTWVCRLSVHRDAAESGTASWAEFVEGFKENHAETEMGFTASVVGAREAAEWDVAPADVVVTEEGGRWVRGSLKLVEMKHDVRPRPLRNRVFPVLQAAAEREEGGEFVVVSIPVSDMQGSSNAEYARQKGVVVASYVSVERFRKLPQSGDIEWIMAVASDAGGVLPRWVQNLAVPGHIAHDVEWFLDWISRQRKAKTSPGTGIEQHSG